MPPKSKRSSKKQIEADALLQEKLDNTCFKYRYYSTDDSEDVGMFEDESPKYLLSDAEAIFSELDIQWDPAVLSILTLEQKQSKTFNSNTLKLFIEMLTVFLAFRIFAYIIF